MHKKHQHIILYGSLSRCIWSGIGPFLLHVQYDNLFTLRRQRNLASHPIQYTFLVQLNRENQYLRLHYLIFVLKMYHSEIPFPAGNN